MILTFFCLVTLLGFLFCLIVTKSAYVLFGAALLFFLLTFLLRRPIRFREGLRVLVFERFTFRVIPVQAERADNPNSIQLYQLDRSDPNSYVGLMAGGNQTACGMSFYRTGTGRDRKVLLLLFPVPDFLKADWLVQFAFGAAALVVLGIFAAIGFLPYRRLQQIDGILNQAARAELLHADSPDVIRNPVLQNVLLLCRAPDGSAEMLDLFCVQCSTAEVMPLQLNTGLCTEVSPGTYQSVRMYAAEHTVPETVRLIEESFCIYIDETVVLDYEWLSRAAAQISVPMKAAEVAYANAWLRQNAPEAGLLTGGGAEEAEPVTCSYEQARAFLHLDDAAPTHGVSKDKTAVRSRAKRQSELTRAILSLLRSFTDRRAALPDMTGAETSFTAEALYSLTETLRSDRMNYAMAYDSCTEEADIETYAVPRVNNFRFLADGSVYAPPGIIRQYMIRLLYY